MKIIEFVCEYGPFNQPSAHLVLGDHGCENGRDYLTAGCATLQEFEEQVAELEKALDIAKRKGRAHFST